MAAYAVQQISHYYLMHLLKRHRVGTGVDDGRKALRVVEGEAGVVFDRPGGNEFGR